MSLKNQDRSITNVYILGQEDMGKQSELAFDKLRGPLALASVTQVRLANCYVPKCWGDG